MTEPEKPKKGILSHLIAFVAGIAATVLGQVAVLHYEKSTFPEAPPEVSVSVTESAESTADLRINTADLTRWESRDYVLLFIPGPKYHWHKLDVVIERKPDVPISTCTLRYDYMCENGIGTGSGLLRLGTPGYSEGWKFNFPEDERMLQKYGFFDGPSPDYPLKWLRVRVVCDKPSTVISPWYEVDLTRARDY